MQQHLPRNRKNGNNQSTDQIQQQKRCMPVVVPEIYSTDACGVTGAMAILNEESTIRNQLDDKAPPIEQHSPIAAKTTLAAPISNIRNKTDISSSQSDKELRQKENKLRKMEEELKKEKVIINDAIKDQSHLKSYSLNLEAKSISCTTNISEKLLFYELETQIIKYSDECPNIFVFGDFNARTAHLNDFVENDLLHDSILDRVDELFAYVADETLPDRSNPDPGTNDYGTKLINLCKCSGLRILNGRHEGSLANDYTYSGPKGMSVIDYLLTRSSNFDIVSKFITCNFTTYSDHAPLHIQFKTNFSIKCNGVQSNFVDAEASKFFRWNEEYKDMCRNALLINSDNIKSTLQNIEAESQDEMDSCVNDFTHQFIDIMAPFFQQSQKSGTEMKRNHKQHYKHIDKPWFDIQCKELYVNYCKTLSIFNGNKSKKNHIELNRVKKTYKDYERKRRRIYMRQEVSYQNRTYEAQKVNLTTITLSPSA
ncbi:unnamed protein product [Mytilus edulis]|uniref:Endonuclease/exonuclease/phosphatase domain-containing protein n=1 Tax=Mytilus edulis TaxID=6550 RepID=A0A8S3QYQ0_MYTED|nr:unnamed protein product [Mytilus edulis]